MKLRSLLVSNIWLHEDDRHTKLNFKDFFSTQVQMKIRGFLLILGNCSSVIIESFLTTFKESSIF